MALIPSINPTKLAPLPGVRGPALDHLARPRVDTSALQSGLLSLGKAGAMPDVDPRAFNAEFEALGAVGKALASAGSVMGAVVEKRAEAKNDADAGDAEAALMDATGKFTKWKAENPNPDLWEEGWKTHAAEATSAVLSNPLLSARGKERIAAGAQRWASRGALAAVEESTTATFKRAASAEEAVYSRSIQSKDYITAGESAKRGEEKGYFFPHQRAAMEAGIVKAQKIDKKEDLLRSVIAAPDAWLAEHPMPAEGEDGDDWAAAHSVAEAASRDALQNTQKAVADYMAGNPLATPGSVTEFAQGRLRPAELEHFTAEAARRLRVGAADESAKPENVKALFGQLLAASDKFMAAPQSSTDPASRESYVALHLAARGLPESLRGEITGPLEKKWRQDSPDIDGTVKDYVGASLKGLYDQGGFGRLEMRVLKGPEDEGFLSYKPDYKTVVDPAGKAAADAKRADATIELNKWMQANPRATRPEATAAIYRLSGEQMRMDEAARILGKADAVSVARSAPAPPDYAAILSSLSPGGLGDGVRVTSYGYSGDDTPDGNSSAGIGSFTTHADAQAEADAPTRLRGGDFAVSQDIEARLAAANIHPRDKLEFTLSDGSRHVGRWMDRTANDEELEKINAKRAAAGKSAIAPLRGRIDVYGPAKQVKDGVSILSFKRVTDAP